MLAALLPRCKSLSLGQYPAQNTDVNVVRVKKSCGEEMKERHLMVKALCAQVPAMAKMGLSTASLPNSLANSLANSGGADLSANLATSRVLASNNLAAQQVRHYLCELRTCPLPVCAARIVKVAVYC